MSLPALVFVHLGRSLPRWVIPNVQDHASRFRGTTILIVNDFHVAKRAQSHGLEVWLDSSSPYVESVEVGDPRILRFRSGFWGSTSNRFLALARFHEEFPSPILQVETDCVLFDAIKTVDFSLMQQSVAFPMASSRFGLGSVVYLRTSSASSSIASYFLTLPSSQVNATQVNDMTRLASFRDHNPESVMVLPTGLPDMDPAYFGQDAEFLKLATDSFAQFEGIFDALTFGQSLAGQDPRNGRGFSVLGTNSAGFYPTQPSLFLHYEDDNLWIENANEMLSYPIFNLHIHSKDLDFFHVTRRRQAFKKRLLSPPGRVSKRFSAWGFASWLRDSTYHRLARNIDS